MNPSLAWSRALLVAGCLATCALPFASGPARADDPREEPGREPGKPTLPGDLDFDLLGEPAAPPPVSPGPDLRLRRTMLATHQALGLGLLGLQLATTAFGQLNYSDRFEGPNTARYRQAHRVLAYATLGAFAATGLVALFAPSPPGKQAQGYDRVTIHWIAMAAAAAGMIGQGALGIATREREGYQNQRDLARTHLALGYVTLAAVLVGLGVLVL